MYAPAIWLQVSVHFRSAFKIGFKTLKTCWRYVNQSKLCYKFYSLSSTLCFYILIQTWLCFLRSCHVWFSFNRKPIADTRRDSSATVLSKDLITDMEYSNIFLPFTELSCFVCQWVLQWLHLPSKHKRFHGSNWRSYRYGIVVALAAFQCRNVGINILTSYLFLVF